MGFTLLETAVASSFVAAVVLGAVCAGPRPPERRTAALALQDAFAETRAIAVDDAAAVGSAATGATLAIEPVVLGARTETRVTVYRSRPIAGAAPLEPDRGFPPLVVPAAISLVGTGSRAAAFGVFVSSAGYASVLPGFAYDPGHPRSVVADPGCAAGVAIAIADAAGSETHPLACRPRFFDADDTETAANAATPSPGAAP